MLCVHANNLVPRAGFPAHSRGVLGGAFCLLALFAGARALCLFCKRVHVRVRWCCRAQTKTQRKRCWERSTGRTRARERDGHMHACRRFLGGRGHSTTNTPHFSNYTSKIDRLPSTFCGAFDKIAAAAANPLHQPRPPTSMHTPNRQRRPTLPPAVACCHATTKKAARRRAAGDEPFSAFPTPLTPPPKTKGRPR